MVRGVTKVVTVALGATVLKIDAPNPASGNVPFITRISGQLTDSGGGGIGGKTVKVYSNDVEFASVLTNNNPYAGWIGIWWADLTITVKGTYSIYAKFAGDASWAASTSSTVTVTATKKATKMVMNEPNPASGQVPLTETISGQLTDSGGGGIGGKTVDIWMSKDGAAYVKIDSTQTNSNPATGWIGIWWSTFIITAAGTYNIYAEFEGDAEWEGCEEKVSVGRHPTRPSLLKRVIPDFSRRT